jgi:hypothetical protein
LVAISLCWGCSRNYALQRAIKAAWKERQWLKLVVALISVATTAVQFTAYTATVTPVAVITVGRFADRTMQGSAVRCAEPKNFFESARSSR